ncbi:hypothetical protein X975_02581, partial [Stegodyphus mimosarum]
KDFGSALYEQVFYHIDLTEKDYFGLQFTDANHVQAHHRILFHHHHHCYSDP